MDLVRDIHRVRDFTVIWNLTRQSLLISRNAQAAFNNRLNALNRGLIPSHPLDRLPKRQLDEDLHAVVTRVTTTRRWQPWRRGHCCVDNEWSSGWQCQTFTTTYLIEDGCGVHSVCTLALTNTPRLHAHTASPRPLAHTHDTNTKRDRNRFPAWMSRWARSWLWISAIPEETWPAMSRHRLMQPDRALARKRQRNETKFETISQLDSPPTSNHSFSGNTRTVGQSCSKPKTVEGGRRSVEVKRTPTFIYIYIYIYIYVYII